MNPTTSRHPGPAPAASTGLHDVIALGDARWDRAPQPWRERQLALPWPPQLLESFVAGMGGHGLSVCRALMMCDRGYALQQLKDAHNLADDRLRLMAIELFRHFEARQSGIPSMH